MISFRFKHVFEILSRWIIGLVFIFSGFVKAVDPLGSAYKFSDYFDVLPLQFMEPLALSLAVLLAGIEFMIGFNLLFRNLNRINLRLLSVFMFFFTALTLWVAIANPVSDCGCFGDALVISNWQTFFKNIFLSLLTVFLLFWSGQGRSRVILLKDWMLTLTFLLFSIGISLYSISNLPLLDFRPYKLGTNIPEQMKVPEGAATDEYLSVFYYEKDGITKEFDESNYPWQDTTWNFVEMKSELISEGYTPPIHDLSFVSLQGDDFTQQILNHKGYTFLLIAPQIDIAQMQKAKSEISEIQQLCMEKEFPFYLLSSTSDNQIIDQLAQYFELPFHILNADEITLKTIIRSNPGLVILKEGHIIGKYASRNIPKASDLADPLAFALSKGRAFKNQINLLPLGLILGTLIFLVSKVGKRDI